MTLTVADEDGLTDTDKMELNVNFTCNSCSIMKGDLDSDVDVDGDDLKIFTQYYGTVPKFP